MFVLLCWRLQLTYVSILAICENRIKNEKNEINGHANENYDFQIPNFLQNPDG